MASRKTHFNRDKAIREITHEFSGLHKIPEDSQSYADFVYEICARYNVSKKTALEYVEIVKAKQRLKVKDEKIQERSGQGEEVSEEPQS